MSKILKVFAVIALVIASGFATSKVQEKPVTVAVCCGLPWCPPGSPCPVTVNK